MVIDCLIEIIKEYKEELELEYNVKERGFDQKGLLHAKIVIETVVRICVSLKES